VFGSKKITAQLSFIEFGPSVAALTPFHADCRKQVQIDKIGREKDKEREKEMKKEKE
jgi:hypothetical protein